MYAGSPEDLVLNDIFGKTFTKEGITFDIKHGVFKVIQPHNAEIYVEGNDVGVFWTKRALERHGYAVTSSQKKPEEITVNKEKNQWRWNYSKGNDAIHFASIEELTSYLIQKGGHP